MNKSVQSPHLDVAIVGGGPAGLAAALALGRACRRVVLFDAGAPARLARGQAGQPGDAVGRRRFHGLLRAGSTARMAPRSTCGLLGRCC